MIAWIVVTLALFGLLALWCRDLQVRLKRQREFAVHVLNSTCIRIEEEQSNLRDYVTTLEKTVEANANRCLLEDSILGDQILELKPKPKAKAAPKKRARK